MGQGAVSKVPTCLLRLKKAFFVQVVWSTRASATSMDTDRTRPPAPHVDRRERRPSQPQHSPQGPGARGSCFAHTSAAQSGRWELSQRWGFFLRAQTCGSSGNAVARVSGPNTQGWRRLGSVGVGRGGAREQRQPPNSEASGSLGFAVCGGSPSPQKVDLLSGL